MLGEIVCLWFELAGLSQTSVYLEVGGGWEEGMFSLDTCDSKLVLFWLELCGKNSVLFTPSPDEFGLGYSQVFTS